MAYTIERPDGVPVLTETGRVRQFRTKAAAETFRQRLIRSTNPAVTPAQQEAIDDAEDLRFIPKRLAEPTLTLDQVLKLHGKKRKNREAR